MKSPRKHKKFFGNYILVKRKDGKVFVRRFPRDLAEWNKTKDPSKVHPNKLKTWINLAETAKKVRGLDYDSAMQTFIKELTGKSVKSIAKLKVVPLADVYGLHLQAIEKGVDPIVVKDLVVPEEFLKLAGLAKKETKVGQAIEAVKKLKNPLMVQRS